MHFEVGIVQFCTSIAKEIYSVPSFIRISNQRQIQSLSSNHAKQECPPHMISIAPTVTAWLGLRSI